MGELKEAHFWLAICSPWCIFVFFLDMSVMEAFFYIPPELQSITHAQFWKLISLRTFPFLGIFLSQQHHFQQNLRHLCLTADRNILSKFNLNQKGSRRSWDLLQPDVVADSHTPVLTRCASASGTAAFAVFLQLTNFTKIELRLRLHWWQICRLLILVFSHAVLLCC